MAASTIAQENQQQTAAFALQQSQKGAASTEAASSEELKNSLAGQRLALSMPKDAVYPREWTRCMQRMPQRDLQALLAVLGNVEGVQTEDLERLTRKFLEFIRQDNRAAYKAQKKAKTFGPVNGEEGASAIPGDDANEFNGSATRAVLRARRTEHLSNILALLSVPADQRLAEIEAQSVIL